METVDGLRRSDRVWQSAGGDPCDGKQWNDHSLLRRWKNNFLGCATIANIVGDFLRSIVGIWLCFLGIPLAAQPDTCLIRNITVNVDGPDGLPVTNLQASDFRGTLRGNAIEVVRATYEKSPRRLLILLDVSKSMTRSPGEWSATLGMLEEFVAGAPSNVSVGVMIFAGGTTLITGFVRDRSTTVARLAGLKTITKQSVEGIGKTAIFDALGTGLSLFGPARPGDSILLVTDAGENASMEKEPQLQKRLLESSVRVFALLVSIEAPIRHCRDH